MPAACHSCGAPITDAVGCRAVCPRCNAYLHCCLNCRLYSPSAHNHCLSSTTEYVRDASAGNFCDEFELQTSKPASQQAPSAKSKFDQLFGE
jgi:hypothetical protein